MTLTQNPNLSDDNRVSRRQWGLSSPQSTSIPLQLQREIHIICVVNTCISTCILSPSQHCATSARSRVRAGARDTDLLRKTGCLEAKIVRRWSRWWWSCRPVVFPVCRRQMRVFALSGMRLSLWGGFAWEGGLWVARYILGNVSCCWNGFFSVDFLWKKWKI